MSGINPIDSTQHGQSNINSTSNESVERNSDSIIEQVDNLIKELTASLGRTDGATKNFSHSKMQATAKRSSISTYNNNPKTIPQSSVNHALKNVKENIANPLKDDSAQFFNESIKLLEEDELKPIKETDIDTKELEEQIGIQNENKPLEGKKVEFLENGIVIMEDKEEESIVFRNRAEYEKYIAIESSNPLEEEGKVDLGKIKQTFTSDHQKILEKAQNANLPQNQTDLLKGAQTLGVGKAKLVFTSEALEEKSQVFVTEISSSKKKEILKEMELLNTIGRIVEPVVDENKNTIGFFTKKGEDFEKFLEDKELNIAEKGNYIKQFAESISNLNKNGFAHCDLKLDNILLIDGKAQVNDFGKAQEIKNRAISSGNDRLNIYSERVNKNFDSPALAMMIMNLIGTVNGETAEQYVVRSDDFNATPRNSKLKRLGGEIKKRLIIMGLKRKNPVEKSIHAYINKLLEEHGKAIDKEYGEVATRKLKVLLEKLTTQNYDNRMSTNEASETLKDIFSNRPNPIIGKHRA